MSLEKAIEALSREFVAQVLAAVRRASLEDLAEVTTPSRPATQRASRPKKTKAGRLPRRSAEDLAKAVSSIVELLEAHPKGLRAKDIQRELRLDPRELPRPIQAALESKQVTKKGNKRATTYFALKLS